MLIFDQCLPYTSCTEAHNPLNFSCRALLQLQPAVPTLSLIYWTLTHKLCLNFSITHLMRDIKIRIPHQRSTLLSTVLYNRFVFSYILRLKSNVNGWYHINWLNTCCHTLISAIVIFAFAWWAILVVVPPLTKGS